MKLLPAFRNFYRIIFLGAFMYSMRNSLTRFLSPHLIPSPEILLLMPEMKPQMIICARNQFNISAANEEGYSSFRNFFRGELNTSTDSEYDISWNGINNQPSDDILKKLFVSNFESLKFISNVTTKDIFILPQGHCKQIIKINERRVTRLHVEIESGAFQVFFTDQRRNLHFKIDETTFSGDPIFLETSTDIMQHRFYEVRFTETIRGDQGFCKSYPTGEFQTFKECNLASDDEEIIPVLGCLPPWMSPRNHCNETVTVPASKFNRLAFGQQSNIDLIRAGMAYSSRSCQGECNKKSVESKFYRQFNSISSNAIYIYFLALFKRTSEFPDFTEQDLLVDIGSNMGLFLGLSIVGILDFATELVLKCSNLRLLD